MCVYSNSRNDVLRVAQRYGTIAAYTRRRASVLVVFVVFCVHMRSFAGLIRWTPPPTFGDTAITDRHSDTTIFQLRAHWVRISWSVGSEKTFGHVPPVGVEPSTSCVQGEHPIHQARLSAFFFRRRSAVKNLFIYFIFCYFIYLFICISNFIIVYHFNFLKQPSNQVQSFLIRRCLNFFNIY